MAACVAHGWRGSYESVVVGSSIWGFFGETREVGRPIGPGLERQSELPDSTGRRVFL